MDLVLWALVAVAIGAFGTLVGVGGGFLLVPLLLFVYPHDPVGQLTAVSLAVVFANAASGSVAYFRLRRADYRTGLILAAATIPGAVLGALVATAIPLKAFDLVMGMVLFLVAILLLLRPNRAIPLLGAGPFSTRRQLTDSSGTRYEYRFNLGLAAVLSVGVGFLSSLLGIGGGVIHVPILTTFFSFPPHVAAATSQVILTFTAAAGTVTHILRGDFGRFVPLTMALAAGIVIGGQAGAILSRRLSGAWLIRLLALALVVVAVRLLLLAL
jgi:uncharacterized protein